MMPDKLVDAGGTIVNLMVATVCLIAFNARIAGTIECVAGYK